MGVGTFAMDIVKIGWVVDFVDLNIVTIGWVVVDASDLGDLKNFHR